jgi:hypothetical protein
MITRPRFRLIDAGQAEVSVLVVDIDDARALTAEGSARHPATLP